MTLTSIERITLLKISNSPQSFEEICRESKLKWHVVKNILDSLEKREFIEKCENIYRISTRNKEAIHSELLDPQKRKDQITEMTVSMITKPSTSLNFRIFKMNEREKTLFEMHMNNLKGFINSLSMNNSYDKKEDEEVFIWGHNKLSSIYSSLYL